MGSKNRPKTQGFDSDSYDDYDEYEDYEAEFGDDFGNTKAPSKDFYSADWEDPSDPGPRISARRRIERRRDLRDLYSQFDDADELDVGNVW